MLIIPLSRIRISAMRLILELFAVLARQVSDRSGLPFPYCPSDMRAFPQGYVCTSAIDTGLSTGYPRLVFSVTKPDPDIEFFMIAFSNNRRHIRLINHPDPLGPTISELLRDQFPRRVTSASWDESDMYKIELNRWDSESTLR